MYDQVFSRLLWKDGTGKANPDLAESWQIAPDNLSITLKLREQPEVARRQSRHRPGLHRLASTTLSDPVLATDPSVMKIKGIMGADQGGDRA